MAEDMDPRLDKLKRALRERDSQLPPDLLRLARAAFGVTDDVLSHEECITWLPEFVDAEIGGERVAEKFPQVKQHLDLCDDCSEQYAELLELTLAERAGDIPVPATIPEPDLGFLQAPVPAPVFLQIPESASVFLGAPALLFPEFVRQKAIAILTAIAPTELPDLLSVADVFFKQVEKLGGEFAFQRGAMKALGLGADEPTPPVATLAVTYSATRKLVDSLSLEQMDALAAQNTLGRRAEEQALLAALELNVKSAMAKNIAREFAALIAADPENLRALIKRGKR